MGSGPLPAPGPPRPCREPPHGGRVLVVAPHPDDESAGVGGLLALHARRGDPVAALFVTTGVHGDPDGAADPEAYVLRRQQEARAAAAELGIDEVEFLPFPDGCAVTEDDLRAVTEHVLAVLQRVVPDVVYAPHAGEIHSDHHFVARAVVAAHADLDPAPHLLLYEVWSPLEAPDLVVDVTPVYETKRRALACYPSQLAHTDLAGAIEGLNRYRAILLADVPADGSHRAEALREVR